MDASPPRSPNATSPSSRASLEQLGDLVFLGFLVGTPLLFLTYWVWAWLGVDTPGVFTRQFLITLVVQSVVCGIVVDRYRRARARRGPYVKLLTPESRDSGEETGVEFEVTFPGRWHDPIFHGLVIALTFFGVFVVPWLGVRLPHLLPV